MSINEKKETKATEAKATEAKATEEATKMKEVVVKESVGVEAVSDEQINALLDQEINNTMAMGGFDFRPGKIGIMHREKKFITVDGQTTNQVTGTIVHFHKARGYWEEEGQQIPTCSSMDGRTGLRRISEDGTETEALNCASCPYNKFGSDPKGGAGKACKEMRRLFVVENDSILPAILNVPPTSIKAFDKYISGLISKKKAHVAHETICRLEGAKSAGFDYSKLVFELGEKHANAKILELLKMREQVVEAAKDIAIEVDDYMNEPADDDVVY